MRPRREGASADGCDAAPVTELASFVLFTADVAATARFYRALAVPLEDEDHGEGDVHAAAELGDVHFAIYPAAGPGRALERRTAGSVFPGVSVTSLDDALAALEDLGASVLSGHEQMPWGCRFVAEDPDGRAVEVNDKEHCGTGSASAGSPG